MTKPISTRVHGMIDYTWTVAASALATRLGRASSTARLLRSAAAAATATSLVTNYEGGAVRLMPMKGHLAADFALCSVLLASPFFLPATERRVAIIPVLLGALGVVTGLLTKTRSPLERYEEFGGYFGVQELAETADKGDTTTAAQLRPHVE
jgi:hypothetical protein